MASSAHRPLVGFGQWGPGQGILGQGILLFISPIGKTLPTGFSWVGRDPQTKFAIPLTVACSI